MAVLRISISGWSSLVISLMLAAGAPAAEPPAKTNSAPTELNPDQIDALIESGLTALTEGNDQQLQAFCRELQARLKGDQLIDLAALRDGAYTVLPLLEQDPETKPFAAWLRARLDYLDVAEELRLRVPSPTPAQPFEPSPVTIRRAWQGQIPSEPVPLRISTLVSQLKPIFRAEETPPELVWLAQVESGFEPGARSPSGAAGMFQLMPDTAKFVDLSLRPIDQRYNPEKSARGAARYLHYLYGKFGDWRLTLAAYNAGEGRVRRLLEQKHAKSFDEITAQLPAETQMYVPKIEAVLLRREGVSLGDLKSMSP
jgi:membrane-bound lytic murein transglycosylase D